jgi:LysM repeat protein
MIKKILFCIAVLLTVTSLYAQVENNTDTFAEDTVSANFEAAITCPTIDSIIQLAFAKKPIATYKYGAAGPNHFDCSGFVYYCFGQYGIKLPRSSRDMFLVGQKVQKEDLQPGDLVFFSRGKLEIGHVGIVIETNIDGNNNFRFIHSSTYKTNVRVDNSISTNYATRYKGARRIISCDGIGGNATILPSDTVFSDTIPPIPTASLVAPATTQSTPSSSQVTTTNPQKPAPVKQQSTVKYHKIKKGETLSSIARKYHTTVANLKKWNKLKSDLIREGQKIIVAK